MYSQSDLQKLVQMLAFLGISSGTGAAHSVLLGGSANAAPGAASTLLASNGPSADPSFQTLAALGIQGALGYTPAHSGANADITSLSGLSTPLSIGQGGTGAITALLSRAALGVSAISIPNILDFGGDNTGSSDNSAAFAAALATGPSGQAAIYFPPGTYAFSSQAVYTMPTNTASITILGAGQEVTKLIWAAGQGLKINFISDANSVHIRDMSLLTGTTNTGSGIFLNQTAANTNYAVNQIVSDITNVTFRGSDGFAFLDYWQYGIQVYGISNINFNNVSGFGLSAHNAGTGVWIWGSSALVPIVFNFNGCQFNELGTGILYGDYTQGVTVNQCNFTNDNVGILSVAGEHTLSQLGVFNSQFNTFSAGITTNTAIIPTIIVGNMFLVQQNSSGINLANYAVTTITGNSIASAVGSTLNQNGIIFGTYIGTSAVVTGNQIEFMTTGIWLESASQFVNVQSNAYAGNTTNVLNSGTNNTVGGGSP